MNCLNCNSLLGKRRRKYCCKDCQYQYELQQVDDICIKCGIVFKVLRCNSLKKRNTHTCRLCINKNYKFPIVSGSNHPRWKGGFRYWSEGRFGQDSNGLSWKVQRRLAWERDNYTCQHCGATSKRKPDVHHVIPWRLSQSHALNNLICLCHSCHMKADAKVA